jgi:hypothetical protein
MKDLRWIYAGSLVGLAGVIALALAAAPSRPTAGTSPAPEATPAVAAVPAPSVVAAGPVAAKPAAVAPAPAPVKKPATSGFVPGSAGLLIGIDPETGEVGMPTAEQVSEMNLTEDEAVSKDFGGVLVRHPGGMLSVDLQGRSQEFGVARKTADGKTVIQCVDDPKHADHIQPAPAGIEEE